MSDIDVLEDVKRRVSGIHMRAPVESILATARARRRRRRRLRFAGAGVVALGLIALGVGSVDRSSSIDGGGLQLASFSVVSNPDGTASLTLTKGEAVDTDTLRRRLAEAGVPAVVTVGRFCHDPTTPDGTFDRVVSIRAGDDGTTVMVITPSAMPDGARLSIGVFPDRRSWTLLPAGSQPICSD